MVFTGEIGLNPDVRTCTHVIGFIDTPPPLFPARCHDLIILETYTSAPGGALALPKFLDIEHEITEDEHYSMYNLSKKPASAMQQRVRSISESDVLAHKLSKHTSR